MSTPIKLTADTLPLEEAWAIIANAHGGDWSKATPEWREAAEQWRDKRWHAAIGVSSQRQPAKPDELAAAKSEIERLEALVDDPIARLQFPDGSCPGNLASCASGWKAWYDRTASERDSLRARIDQAKPAAERGTSINSLREIKPEHLESGYNRHLQACILELDTRLAKLERDGNYLPLRDWTRTDFGWKCIAHGHAWDGEGPTPTNGCAECGLQKFRAPGGAKETQ